MPFPFAAVAAGISAVGSIAGGIMGAKNASSQNSRAKKQAKEQQKFNKEIAKLQNKHNEKLDKADEANYKAMRDFNHESALKIWQRNAEMQDFQFLNSLKEYQKSTAIGNAQLGLNAKAAQLGVQAEQDALQETFIQQQFQYKNTLSDLKQTYVEQNFNSFDQFQKLEGIRNRQRFGSENFRNTVDQLTTQSALTQEAEMVKGLVAEGSIQATRQAGKSTAKGLQSNMAQLQRGLQALDSELSGKYRQAAVQMAELNVDSSLQAAGVGLNLKRIETAVQNAESEAEGNLEVLRENMKSELNQTLRNVKQIEFDRLTANVNTRAGMMLFPERLSYEPRPEKPPERIFIERMEAVPGYVPPPQQQSVWAPLISGITNAAGTMANPKLYQ
jgi:hypothetical protein